MNVATRDLNGNVKYFNAFTGKEVRLNREPGRYERHIPDYAFRFISPKIENKQGFVNAGQSLPSSSEFSQFKKPFRIVPGEKPSLWSRMIQWFKSFFNGKR